MSEFAGASSPNTEPQLLLESGPMMVRDFNPKGVLYWTGRKCLTCNGEILDHWLISFADPELKGRYWCDRDGKGWSGGIAGCTSSIDGFIIPQEPHGTLGASAPQERP